MTPSLFDISNSRNVVYNVLHEAQLNLNLSLSVNKI